MFPSNVNASSINPDMIGSMSLSYKIDDMGIEGLNIQAYRIASFEEDGSYEILAPYNEYKNSLNTKADKITCSLLFKKYLKGER